MPSVGGVGWCVCVWVGGDGRGRGGRGGGGGKVGKGVSRLMSLLGGGEVVDAVRGVVVGDPTIFISPLDLSRTMYDKPAGYS